MYQGVFHVRCRKWAYREHQVVAVVLPTISRHDRFPDPFSNLNFQKQLATFSRLDVRLGTNEKTMSPCSCPFHVFNKPSQVSKHSSTMVLAEAAEREQICFIFYLTGILFFFFVVFHTTMREMMMFYSFFISTYTTSVFCMYLHGYVDRICNTTYPDASKLFRKLFGSVLFRQVTSFILLLPTLQQPLRQPLVWEGGGSVFWSDAQMVPCIVFPLGIFSDDKNIPLCPKNRISVK